MSAGLQAPVVADVVTRWAAQPVALAVAAIAAAWYARSVHALRRDPAPPTGRAGWPRWRAISFALGIVLLAWTTSGFLEVYSRSLFWVWTSQQLLLLLVVPIVLMAGQPIELARRINGEQSLLVRLIGSRFGRPFANPLFGPVLIPLLSFALFFGPVAGWAVAYDAVGWILPVVIVAIGALIVLPLVSPDDNRGSVAVGIGLTLGIFELALDAIPGIVMRLHTKLVTSYFDYRHDHVWASTPLHDQQLSGTILWCVAQLIGLPFLLLVYRRWLRADARDAAEIDTVLDAERIARGEPVDGTTGASDPPWWLSDPGMRERYRR